MEDGLSQPTLSTGTDSNNTNSTTASGPASQQGDGPASQDSNASVAETTSSAGGLPEADSTVPAVSGTTSSQVTSADALPTLSTSESSVPGSALPGVRELISQRGWQDGDLFVSVQYIG